jgi:PAS domain-containing protein
MYDPRQELELIRALKISSNEESGSRPLSMSSDDATEVESASTMTNSQDSSHSSQHSRQRGDPSVSDDFTEEGFDLLQDHTPRAKPMKEPQKGTIEYYMSLQEERVLIISSSAPFHIQYASKAWAQTTGWSPEEVLGFDCKFLQGEGTDLASVRRFMLSIDNCCGKGTLEILNYTKSGDLMKNKVVCHPVITGYDDGSDDSSDQTEHLACILEECVPVKHDDVRANISMRPFEEIGMCLDRRDQCKMYPHLNRYPAPSYKEWGIISSKLTLSLAIKYMLEVQMPMILTDKQGCITHMNSAWCTWTQFTSIDCLDETFLNFIDEHLTEPESVDIVEKLLEDNTTHSPATYTKVYVKTRPLLRRCRSSSLTLGPATPGSARSRGSVSSRSSSITTMAMDEFLFPSTCHTMSAVTLETAHRLVVLFPCLPEQDHEGRIE